MPGAYAHITGPDAYIHACVLDAAACPSGGTAPFGTDYFYSYITNQLCPIAGGAWSDSSTAGVWASYWLTARTSSFHSVGFRAASYL